MEREGSGDEEVAYPSEEARGLVYCLVSICKLTWLVAEHGQVRNGRKCAQRRVEWLAASVQRLRRAEGSITYLPKWRFRVVKVQMIANEPESVWSMVYAQR